MVVEVGLHLGEAGINDDLAVRSLVAADMAGLGDADGDFFSVHGPFRRS